MEKTKGKDADSWLNEEIYKKIHAHIASWPTWKQEYAFSSPYLTSKHEKEKSQEQP